MLQSLSMYRAQSLFVNSFFDKMVTGFLLPDGIALMPFATDV